MRTLQHMGRLVATCLLSLGLLCASTQSASAQTATTTTLTITNGVTAVTSVTAGTVISLTATVLANGFAFTPGQVNFCNAAAAHCTDINLLGTAQLLANGTATFKFIPGTGVHSYMAVFVGTTANAKSTSAAMPLTVTRTSGTTSSTTTIVSSGVPGNYTLTATVLGLNGVTAPTGTITFNDTTTNSILGTAPLIDSGQAAPSFLNSFNAPTGTLPQSVVTGDFNGDGIPDIAVASSGGNTVNILLGRGNGGFNTSPPIAFPAGSFSSYLVVGDFNGDGKLDFAVTLNNTGVEIFLGNGDGTFTAGQTINTVSSNEVGGFLVAGDFNDDGNMDLAQAVAGPSPGSFHLVILLGNGHGTFTMVPTEPTTNQSWSMVTGDFNNDGKLDIASTSFVDNTVNILLGNGDGTFTQGASINTGALNLGIGAADLTGNGDIDLVVSNKSNASISTLMNDGHGNFTQLPAEPATAAISEIAVTADFNNDGIPDLVLEDISTSNIYLYLGNGDGTFTLSTTTPLGQNFLTRSAAVADFNGDGRQDLALAVSDNNSPQVTGDQVQVYLSQSGATATASINHIAVTGVHTHFADASYPGDSNYTSSLSGLIPLINPNAINGTLTASPEPSIYDEDNFTLTATVMPATTSITPTGTVTFFIDGTQVGTPVTLAPSTGTSATASLLVPAGISYAVGAHTLAANYSGDQNSSPITVPGTHTISPIPTVTSVTLSVPAPPGGYIYGQDYAALVSVVNVGTPVVPDDPTGDIIMTLDGVQNCVIVIGGGTCFNPLADAAPNQPLVGTYQGDASHATSSGALAGGGITVVQDTSTPSTTLLAASSGGNPVILGNPITFTTTVTGLFASPVGTITFLDGGTALGPPVTLTTGVGGSHTSTASFTTSVLTLGTHTLTARYTPTVVIIPPNTPTTDFLASVSPSISQQIIPPPMADFIVTITPNPLVVGIGLPSSAVVTVAAINGWTADVTLACPASANLPYESTCTLVDTTIPGGSGTTALIMTTMSPHDCGSNVPYFTGTAQMEMKFGGAAMAGLLIWLLPRKRRVLKGLLLALLCVLPGVMGCGRCTDLGTRPQTYGIVITGTGVGTSVTHTVNLPMQVNL